MELLNNFFLLCKIHFLIFLSLQNELTERCIKSVCSHQGEVQRLDRLPGSGPDGLQNCAGKPAGRSEYCSASIVQFIWRKWKGKRENVRWETRSRITSCHASHDTAEHVTYSDLWPPGSLCGGRTQWTWWWWVPSWSCGTAATRPSAGRSGWCRTWAGGFGCVSLVWPRNTRTGTAGSSTWTSGSAHWAGL